VAIHPERREVVIGSEAELAGHSATIETVNWLSEPLVPGDDCFVRVRHRGTLAPATITSRTDDTISVAFGEPVRAISPGQSAVLYAADAQVLGGGVLA